MGWDDTIHLVSSALSRALMATENFRCKRKIPLGGATSSHAPDLQQALAAHNISCDEVAVKGGNFRISIGPHYIFA